MSHFELVVVLLATAVPLVALARLVRIAYPIVLVLGGLGIGFLPFVPAVAVPPDLVLVVFLPPLLFYEASTAPLRAFRAFLQPIVRLAVGLVIVTTGAVAAVVHAFVPDIPWGAAAALGAIVAPTDQVAVMPVAERLGLPRRALAVLQGESLLNDATALVLYAVAIQAVVSGRFSWLAAGEKLLWSGPASIAIGVLTGVVIVTILRSVRDPMLDVLVSLLAGYLAYIPAVHLGLSGVLATVTCAFYVARFTPRSVDPEARVLNRGMWPVLIFTLNATIFMFVGLQVRAVVTQLHGTPWTTLALWSAALCAVVIVVRVVWLMGIAYPIDRYVRRFEETPPWRNYALVSWAGLRGGVSLAAALAIPMATASHAPFPHRVLLIFLTFVVIFTTLVGQGATLPLVIRSLQVPDDDEDLRERGEAMTRATAFSLDRLAERAAAGRVDADVARALRERYEQTHLDDDSSDVIAFHRAELDLLGDQHGEIVRMRDRGEIENTTMGHLEANLDFKRLQLEEEVSRTDALERID